MTLLVAYIATAGGQDAVALGSVLARATGSDLAISLVIPPDTHDNPTNDHFEEVLEGKVREWLAQAAAEVPEDVTADTHTVVDENPAAGIIAEAQRVGAQMLVVGGSGGGLLGRHSLGTVVNDLLHSSPIPVALAPSGFRYTGPDAIGRITAAIGRRPGKHGVVETAADVGGHQHLPIRLVSLVAIDEMAQHRGISAGEATAAATAHVTKAADELRTNLPGDAEVSVDVVHGTSVEEAIAKLDWRPDDLIVVGSSRLAAPKRTFLGNTAAKMLRVLAVPMIVVPRHEDAG